VTSGSLETACCYRLRFSLVLCVKSPTERETARSAFTLPFTTELPAFAIRAFSVSLSGLWSVESPIISFPLKYKTALQSPQFEVIRVSSLS